MGFQIERFIGDVDEEFICPICSGVLEDPFQTPDCEHAFCRACITEWISRQPTCPVDRQPITASQLRPVPRLIRNLLSRLWMSCDYVPHGCKAVLKLESLASHLVECEFNPKRPVPCEAGCGLVIPKDELAKHNCFRELWALIVTHQEKSDDYEEELAELKRAHQEKLNDHKQELAELKRAHQEKLNDYKQELAELKRELEELKESKQVERLVDQREREGVVRWSNSLAYSTFGSIFSVVAAPGNDLRISIKRSLSESGCPPHILDDLVKHCEFGRWPHFVRSSYLGNSLRYISEANYVYKRVPGHQAVLILHCDNTHVDEQQMMVKPGFIIVFKSGVL